MEWSVPSLDQRLQQLHQEYPRPGWDNLFLMVASVYKRRSTCNRLQVGAVLVDRHNRVISLGYNGSPPGEPHCIDSPNGCLMENGHCIRTVHAEENALLFADDWGRVFGSTMYVDGGLPCYHCSNLLITKSVARVVYLGDYFNENAALMLARQNVQTDCWNGRVEWTANVASIALPTVPGPSIP